MKKLIGIGGFLALTFTLAGQGEDTEKMGAYEAKENLRELGSTSGTGAVQTFDNRYKGVKGSVYMFESWYPGEVFLKDKTKVLFPNLNYDVFENYVVYKEEEEGSVFEVNKKIIDFFLLYTTDTLKFVPVHLPKSDQASFGEMLYSGQTKLYRIYQKEFLKANYEGGYSADRKYDEFIDKVTIYAQFPGEQEMIKLKLNRGMSKQFPMHTAEMKKYIGKYNSSELKGQNVIRDIMKYYDSLK